MTAFIVKATLILLAGVVATALMRRASAASRHVVLLASLVGALLVPFAASMLPSLELPVLPPVTVYRTEPVQSSQPSLSLAATQHPAAAPQSAPSRADEIAPGTAEPWLALLVISGGLLLVIRTITSRVMRRRLWAHAAPCDSLRITEATHRIASLLGVTRAVRIRLAPVGDMPITFGALSPKLILPADAVHWQDDRLDAVLTHELAHIVRLDAVSQLATRVSSAMYWYHPLALWLARQARLERERACDDIVLRLGMRPSSYAEHLLALRTGLSVGADIALPMARRAQMADRLRAILDPRQTRSARSRLSLAVAAAIVILSGLVGAAVATARVQSLTELSRPALPEREAFTAIPPPVAAKPGTVASRDTVPSASLQSRLAAMDRPQSERASAAEMMAAPVGGSNNPATSPVQTAVDFSGTWEPVAAEAGRLETLWDVGLAFVRGRFTITQSPDTISVSQSLPADLAQARLAITGFDPLQRVYDLSAWTNANRLEGGQLVWRFTQGTPVRFQRVQPGSVATQTTPQTTAQPIPAGQFGAGAYRPGNGITNPVRLREVKPPYTPQARRAGIAGTVELEAVVGANGTVTDVRVVRSLDDVLGLDKSAMDAVRQTPFVPCKINGQPVACLVIFELQFTLPPVAPIPAGRFGEGAYWLRDGADMKPPTQIREVKPQYTPEAMRRRLQGKVIVEAVVRTDGTVGDARVVDSLDAVYGLDQQAINAAKATKFTPAKLNGSPIAVVVTLEMVFALR